MIVINLGLPDWSQVKGEHFGFAKEIMNDPKNECYAHFYGQSCIVYILYTLMFSLLDINIEFIIVYNIGNISINQNIILFAN